MGDADSKKTQAMEKIKEEFEFHECGRVIFYGNQLGTDEGKDVKNGKIVKRWPAVISELVAVNCSLFTVHHLQFAIFRILQQH